MLNYFDNRFSVDGQLLLSDNSFNQGKGISIESDYSLADLKYFFDFEYFDKNLDIEELGALHRNNLKKIKHGLIFRDLDPSQSIRSKSITILNNYQENIDAIRLKNDLIIKGHLSLMNNLNFEMGVIY